MNHDINSNESLERDNRLYQGRLKQGAEAIRYLQFVWG